MPRDLKAHPPPGLNRRNENRYGTVVSLRKRAHVDGEQRIPFGVSQPVRVPTGNREPETPVVQLRRHIESHTERI